MTKCVSPTGFLATKVYINQQMHGEVCNYKGKCKLILLRQSECLCVCGFVGASGGVCVDCHIHKVANECLCV